MKQFFLLSMIWVVTAMIGGPAALPGEKRPATTASAVKITWRTNYQQARHEAAATKRPLLLLLRNGHCLWCDKLENAIANDPELTNLLTISLVPIKLLAEKEPVVFQMLRIERYPTMVLAGADGKILARMEGFQPPLTMRKAITGALDSLQAASKGDGE
jgi:thioredoxin-related protein